MKINNQVRKEKILELKFNPSKTVNEYTEKKKARNATMCKSFPTFQYLLKKIDLIISFE